MPPGALLLATLSAILVTGRGLVARPLASRAEWPGLDAGPLAVTGLAEWTYQGENPDCETKKTGISQASPHFVSKYLMVMNGWLFSDTPTASPTALLLRNHS